MIVHAALAFWVGKQLRWEGSLSAAEQLEAKTATATNKHGVHDDRHKVGLQRAQGEPETTCKVNAASASRRQNKFCWTAFRRLGGRRRPPRRRKRRQPNEAATQD
jgi:hypothetical protein